MLTFIVRRLLLAVPVLLGVVFVVMLTVDLLPGDAVTLMLGEHATKDAVAKLRDHLGLDKPFLVRYLEYVGRVVRGDLGRSIQQNRPVAAELADAWPATLELTIAALVIATLVGVPAGIVSAIRPNSIFDALARLGSLFGLSMPIFWTGLVLIVVFSLWLNWLPVGGAGSLAHLVLPAVTLALFQVALVMRLVRAEMLEVLRTDYIKFARARGLTDRAIHFGHALKNTLVPVITITGLQLGGIIAFAIVTETVFQWPGMGLLFIQAINFADIPVMAAYLCFIALVFVLINLVVDLMYYAVDPRLRIERDAAH